MTDPPSTPGIMVFAGLGLLSAVCLLAGLGLGWWVDRELHTLPLFLLLGLLVGILSSVLVIRSELRRYG